ncbi:MAG: flagellar basal body rod protein FlgB [Lachnospiraceae bacterium]|nr:flagellar basal body rod protein FlgB [Lachnospiraceae bacterium]
MINANVFNYVNVLDKAADASWLRNDAITNNIANATTPNYKRQDVDFEGELQRALKNSRYESMDSKVSNLHTSRLNARTYTDYDGFSYRLDGNNVDIQTENVTLVKNQIKYNGLIQSINQEFANLKSVTK